MSLASGKGWITPTLKQEIESMISLDKESIRLLREVLARGGKAKKTLPPENPKKGPSETRPDPNSKATAHRKAITWLWEMGANPRDYVVKVDPRGRGQRTARNVQILVVDEGKYWRVLTLQTTDDGMFVVGNQIDKVYARAGLRVRLALAPLMDVP